MILDFVGILGRGSSGGRSQSVLVGLGDAPEA